MKNSLFTILTVFALACATLVSCDPNLDYDNIDPSAKLSMALTLPVGSAEASFGDFLGNNTIEAISTDENGVYHLNYTKNLDRTFHVINISNYYSQTDQEFKPTSLGVPMLPAGQKITLEFPMVIELNDMNTTASLHNERIDSVYVLEASFNSSFTQNFGLNWSDITKLDLVLPAETFYREKGLVINVPLDGKNFGDEIPVVVDDFMLNLMQDRTLPPSTTNVQHSVTMYMRFEVVPSTTLMLTDESVFAYHFGINFLDYGAIFGWFDLDPQMFVTDSFELDKEWDVWKDLRSLKLNLYDPQVTMDIATTVAAPIMFHLNSFATYRRGETDTLYAHNFSKENPQGKTFDKYFTNYVTVNDPLGTIHQLEPAVTFSKDFGALDQLVNSHPDVIVMDYYFNTYAGTPGNEQTQYRLDKDTKVHVNAVIDAPFQFNEGTDLTYSTSFEVNMSDASLDSLLAEIEQVDSVSVNDIRLVMAAESYIPFDLSAKVSFLDENDQVLGITMNEDNMIKLNGPSEYSAEKIEPGTSTITVSVDNDDLKLLTKVRKIALDLKLADMANAKNVTYPVSLGTFTKLKIKFAVSADVDAYAQLVFNE